MLKYDESLYKEGMKYAKKFITRGKLELDPLDLVHNAILKSTDRESFFNNIKKDYYLEYSNKNIKADLISLDSIKENNIVQIKEETRQCKKCLDVMSTIFFPKDFFSKNDGHVVKINRCKSCIAKTRKEKGWGKSEKCKKSTAKRVKKYWEKERNAASEKYVINKILRRHYKKEDITQELIEKKQKILLEKLLGLKRPKTQKEYSKKQKEKYKKEIKELSDNYIKKLILRRKPELKNLITKEMIKDRRNLLIKKRQNDNLSTKY